MTTAAQTMLADEFQKLLSDLQLAWGDHGGKYQVGHDDLCLLERVAAALRSANPNAEVREALEWYAKGGNNWDRGKRAKAALASQQSASAVSRPDRGTE